MSYVVPSPSTVAMVTVCGTQPGPTPIGTGSKMAGKFPGNHSGVGKSQENHREIIGKYKYNMGNPMEFGCKWRLIAGKSSKNLQCSKLCQLAIGNMCHYAVYSDKSSWFKPSISWKEQNRIWGMLQRYVQTVLEVYNVYVDFARV